MTYELKLTQSKAYIKSALFIAANIALPHLFHLIPGGGVMFLPIYFFTLVAAMRYGWQVGLLTSIMTPVLGWLIFSAPAFALVPDMLLKGALLVGVAYFTKKHLGCNLVSNIITVALAFAFAGLLEWSFMGASIAFQDFVTGLPGMAMMILGSWLINKYVK